MYNTNATCHNHPERAAVEHCEVCHTPLCAYCLYYTSDGQRLCKTHANKAEAAGAFIRSPGNYADGLVPAQVEASRPRSNPPAAMYEGNTPDVVGLIALIVGIISASMCAFPLICLLGPIGIVLGLIALLNTKDARNPKRTRSMAWIGIALSSLWIIVMFACILFFIQGSVFTSTTNLGLGQIPVTFNARVTIAVATARPTITSRASAFRTRTPLPTATSAPTATPAATSTPDSR